MSRNSVYQPTSSSPHVMASSSNTSTPQISSSNPWIASTPRNNRNDHTEIATLSDMVDAYRTYLHARAVHADHLSTLVDTLYHRDDGNYLGSGVTVISGEVGNCLEIKRYFDTGVEWDVLKDHLLIGGKAISSGRRRVIVIEGFTPATMAVVGSCVKNVVPELWVDHLTRFKKTGMGFGRASRSQRTLSINVMRKASAIGKDTTDPRMVMNPERGGISCSIVKDEDGIGSTIILIVDPVPNPKSLRFESNQPVSKYRRGNLYETIVGLLSELDVEEVDNMWSDPLYAYLLTLRCVTSYWVDYLVAIESSILPIVSTHCRTKMDGALWQRQIDDILATVTKDLGETLQDIRRYEKTSQVVIGGTRKEIILSLQHCGMEETKLLLLDYEDLSNRASQLQHTTEYIFADYFRRHSVIEAGKAMEHARTGISHATAGVGQASCVQRLTQLAFVYVPLSFVANLMSMNITSFFSETVPKIAKYFAISIPLLFITTIVACYLPKTWHLIYTWLYNITFRTHYTRLDYHLKVGWARKEGGYWNPGTNPASKAWAWVRSWFGKPGIPQLDSFEYCPDETVADKWDREQEEAFPFFRKKMAVGGNPQNSTDRLPHITSQYPTLYPPPPPRSRASSGTYQSLQTAHTRLNTSYRPSQLSQISLAPPFPAASPPPPPPPRKDTIKRKPLHGRTLVPSAPPTSPSNPPTLYFAAEEALADPEATPRRHVAIKRKPPPAPAIYTSPSQPRPPSDGFSWTVGDDRASYVRPDSSVPSPASPVPPLRFYKRPSTVAETDTWQEHQGLENTGVERVPLHYGYDMDGNRLYDVDVDNGGDGDGDGGGGGGGDSEVGEWGGRMRGSSVWGEDSGGWDEERARLGMGVLGPCEGGGKVV